LAGHTVELSSRGGDAVAAPPVVTGPVCASVTGTDDRPAGHHQPGSKLGPARTTGSGATGGSRARSRVTQDGRARPEQQAHLTLDLSMPSKRPDDDDWRRSDAHRHQPQQSARSPPRGQQDEGMSSTNCRKADAAPTLDGPGLREDGRRLHQDPVNLKNRVCRRDAGCCEAATTQADRVSR